MKKYTLSVGSSIGYAHPHPERTAYRETYSGHAMGSGDYVFQVWPNRAAMARSIRMQEKRERRRDDWRPVVKLTPGEGF